MVYKVKAGINLEDYGFKKLKHGYVKRFEDVEILVTKSFIAAYYNFEEVAVEPYLHLIVDILDGTYRKCEICEDSNSQLRYFKKGNYIYCEDCILNRVEDLESYEVTSYYYNSEYIGNSNDMDEVLDALVDKDNMEEIK